MRRVLNIHFFNCFFSPRPVLHTRKMNFDVNERRARFNKARQENRRLSRTHTHTHTVCSLDCWSEAFSQHVMTSCFTTVSFLFFFFLLLPFCQWTCKSNLYRYSIQNRKCHIPTDFHELFVRGGTAAFPETRE